MTVGLLTGVGAIGLRWLIQGVRWLFFVKWVGIATVVPLPVPTWLLTVLAPALGMIVVSWIVQRWAPEAEGHGVPEVQYAIRMKGGRIRKRVALVKAIASAITIGSGGSVGREGPIVQIGSSLGSTIGQIFRLGSEEIRILVAAGAGAAIGGTFNAPIAGVLFALEVVLGSFAARSFGLVVVASVAATAVVQAVLGTEPAFRLVEQFTLVSHWEFGLYLLLGVAAGLVALLYVRTVYGLEARLEAWFRVPWVRAVAGGLAVGLIGTFGSRQIFGVGHEGVELALTGGLTVTFMLSLVLLKIVATSLSLGAGGSGGVFAPSLFIGAMLGGAFGRMAGAVFPTVTASPGAYALVGAAALFGAAAHAPFTSIVILFEMTDNYRIILPLMFAVVVAHLIASSINPDSIYSIKLRHLGGFGSARGEVGTLDLLLVADAMADEVPTVHRDLPVDSLAALAQGHATRSWVVLDDEERAVGIVAVTDLERAIMGGDFEGRTVGDIMTATMVTCQPGETLREAFQRFTERDVYQIPVVDPEDPDRVVGVLRRTEMLWAYKQLSAEHQRLLDRTNAIPRDGRGEAVHMELQVRREHRAICHRPIREIRVPENSLIALLRRGDRVVVPRGFTRVEPGDVLTLITTRGHEDELRVWISRQSGTR